MNNITINSTVLNILRVYATALVFFCHSTIIAKECFGFELYGFERLINTPAWGGVWMFLVMGGFLAAYGFDQQKYSLDKNGVLKYYKGRVVKVLVPTYIFLSLMYIFNMQEANVKWTTILQWITCTFNGRGADIKRVGASWYVFIIMWLYLLAPILLRLLYGFEKNHNGRELKSYVKMLFFFCSIGFMVRVFGFFLNAKINDEIYYDWFYANVSGTIDLFVIGMIGERMMHYIPEICETVKKMRIYLPIVLFITTSIFVKHQGFFYRTLGPMLFALCTIFLIIAYSYRTKGAVSQINGYRFSFFCNVISPYTFMFYLWHSPLLGYVADKLEVQNSHLHYWGMLIIGGLVTAYVAFLMTKMNNGIIKSLIDR